MKRWWPFLLWLLLVVGIIACANGGLIHGFFSWVERVPLGDKAGHFILVGCLAFFLNHALRQARVSILRRQVLLGGAVVAVVITLEELSQIWIPNRHFDLGDLIANYAGIYLAGAIAVWPGLKPSVSGERNPPSGTADPLDRSLGRTPESFP